MKTFPVPALVAAAAALATLPFSLAAAGTLFLTAGLGVIIHADYVLRHRRTPLPRYQWREADAQIHAFAVQTEQHRLAA